MRIELHTAHDRPAPSGLSVPQDAFSIGASAVVRVFGGSSDVVASCAMWTRELPSIAGKRLGYIGRFDCTDATAGGAALDAACSWLAREDCRLAVGPLDGSTWHRYRFVTESSVEPTFSMEPTNPPEWPELWKRAGFSSLATYHSSLNEELTFQDPLGEEASSRARAAGLSLRPLNMAAFELELRAIFELSLNAFADNYLYTPIAWDEFAGMYSRMKNLLDPRLVLLCDDPGRPGALAGYIMAFPDLLERQRTGQSQTLILKSMAVHTGWRSVRLGTWLIAQAQANAKALGMSRSIFALMHDANPSARIGRHYSRVIRRYTLFARELAP
jgi:GNAT superfamily N-acetyltransferase